MATRANWRMGFADPETESGSRAVPNSRVYDSDQSAWGIKQLSAFDTGLDSEIPIDTIGGSRPAESVRHRVVAPPVRYACDDG